MKAPGPNNGVGGRGGLVWEAGSGFAFMGHLFDFLFDVGTIIASAGTAYSTYLEAIEDGYGAIQEGVKIWENKKNRLLSAGQGGRAPSTGYVPGLPYFSVPLGGGGGGEPSLKIVTPGYLSTGNWSGEKGSIIGTGGNGGHGGDGSGGWEQQAAPGGGGGGGNGAQVHIIAKQIANDGKISLKGGLGGASGRLNSEINDPSNFVADGFGISGKNGILRVDGKYGLNTPQDADFYMGPDHTYNVFFPSNSNYCTYFFLGDQVGWKNFCFVLQQGLNAIAAKDIPLHPWQKQFAFYWQDQDSDGDGLADAIETILGTNPNNPDSDGDGLKDGEEVYTYGTDPLNSDTDGDGYSDSYEIAHRSDPKNAADIPVNSLLVAKTGDGSGLVTSSPAGVDCGSTCHKAFDPGTSITLTASPFIPGSYFMGWSGGGCSGTGTCAFTLNADTEISASFQSQGSPMAANLYHTTALDFYGQIWAWGQNSSGQLGDGTNENKNQPIQIGTDSDWVSATGGAGHSLAIKADGTLWAWGSNGSGQLGDGTATASLVPTQIGTDTDWVSVEGGVTHSLAIKSTGTLWAWGNNTYGQLGDGTNATRWVPTQIGTDTDWVSVSTCLSHSLGLKSDGTVWAWGYNSYGELGDYTNVDKNYPVQSGGMPVSAAPTGLTATDGAYPDKVVLNWSAPATGTGGPVTGYKVYRHTSDNYAAAVQVGTSAFTSYDDPVGDINTHWYWVRAFNDTGDGPYSNGDTGYQQALNLTVSRVSMGNGCVADGLVTGPGITCGYSYVFNPPVVGDDCSEQYAQGTSVTLTGFGCDSIYCWVDHWDGCDVNPPQFDTQCTVTMNTPKSVTVYFNTWCIGG